MRVIALYREFEATTVDELKTVLAKRDTNGANFFWLAHESDFPTIAIAVKADLAYLNYIPKEYEAGFRSVGEIPGLDPGGMTTFPISTGEDTIDVLNESLVPYSTALAAAVEFFHYKALPLVLEWFEL